MPNVVTEHKTPIQWAALVATAALFWAVIWGIGSQFRDHLLADVRGLISDHADAVDENQVEFFRAVESKADNAIGRIGTLESNCAVVQSRLTGYEAQLSTLDRWRGNCSERMATVTQYMDRDEKDVRELRQTISELRAYIESMRWRQ